MVVVVENMPDLARLFALMLEPYAEVRCYCANFEQLLDPKVWEGVDAALVDLMLGESVTGLAICSFVKAHAPGVRTVLLTADASHEPSDDADVTLTKPQPTESILTALGLIR